jgi:hypothetical protein
LEGVEDVLIVQALYRSASVREAKKLGEFEKEEMPSLKQEIYRPATKSLKVFMPHLLILKINATSNLRVSLLIFHFHCKGCELDF